MPKDNHQLISDDHYIMLADIMYLDMMHLRPHECITNSLSLRAISQAQYLHKLFLQAQLLKLDKNKV